MQKISAWHQTKTGFAVFGLAELLAAYLMGSRALDTGSLWQYAITLLLLIGFLRNTYSLALLLVKGLKRGNK